MAARAAGAGSRANLMDPAQVDMPVAAAKQAQKERLISGRHWLQTRDPAGWAHIERRERARRPRARRVYASVIQLRVRPGQYRHDNGFALAIVFIVQGLTGWEAAVPLAEETENPRRNVPRATMASILIIGLMLVLVIWGR